MAERHDDERSGRAEPVGDERRTDPGVGGASDDGARTNGRDARLDPAAHPALDASAQALRLNAEELRLRDDELRRTAELARDVEERVARLASEVAKVREAARRTDPERIIEQGGAA